MKVLLVDDEPPARRRMRRLLEKTASVSAILEAADGIEAISVVQQENPDALFLDIRMPGLDGLALARQYVELPPVVFVTALREHAVEAFEVHAVDYLLKPVDPARLEQAIVRLQARTGQSPDRDGAAIDAVAAQVKAAPTLVCSSAGQVRLYDSRSVSHFWASDKYTAFRVEDREELTDRSLNTLETGLAPFGYIRVHRAHLVDRAAVVSLQQADGRAELALTDGTVIPVSRRYTARVKEALRDDGFPTKTS